MEKEELEVIEGNPKRKDRLKALMEGKILRINFLEEGGRVRYIRMNEYFQLEYSLTGLTDSFHQFQNGFDFSSALEDVNQYGIPKRVLILDDCH